MKRNEVALNLYSLCLNRCFCDDLRKFLKIFLDRVDVISVVVVSLLSSNPSTAFRQALMKHVTDNENKKYRNRLQHWPPPASISNSSNTFLQRKSDSLKNPMIISQNLELSQCTSLGNTLFARTGDRIGRERIYGFCKPFNTKTL